VVSGVVLFILPCVLINYLLIFRNNRYEKLLNKYPNYGGKLAHSYFLTSMLLPLILILIIFFKQRGWWDNIIDYLFH
jgi:hypothetical protein